MQSTLMIMNPKEVLSIRNNAIQSNHGQVINKQIEEMLSEAELSFDQLDGVCVLNGPGSYTGLRISLSTAKGICYAKNIPLVLIHRLDLMYQSVPESIQSKPVMVIMKARENEFFTGLYLSSADKQYALLSKEELSLQCEASNATLAFEGSLYADEFSYYVEIQLEIQTIKDICFDYFLQSNHADLFSSEPFYMKNVFINKINNL